MAAPPTSQPAIVEVLISGSGISDAERFDLPTESTARSFAREVMDFALHPDRRRRRAARAATPVDPERSDR